MLTQILNYKTEIQQHLLVFVFFLGFIFYSLFNQLGLNIWIFLVLVGACMLSVYFLMKNQAKYRKMVFPQVIEKANKYRVIQRKSVWIVLPFLFFSILTGLHFYIVYLGTGDFLPMVYDYAFGGVFALAFNIYMFKKWEIGISDDGIIIGSRFDAKLILWENVKNVIISDGSILIQINNTSITSLRLSNFEHEKMFKKLLHYKVV